MSPSQHACGPLHLLALVSPHRGQTFSNLETRSRAAAILVSGSIWTGALDCSFARFRAVSTSIFAECSGPNAAKLRHWLRQPWAVSSAMSLLVDPATSQLGTPTTSFLGVASLSQSQHRIRKLTVPGTLMLQTVIQGVRQVDGWCSRGLMGDSLATHRWCMVSTQQVLRSLTLQALARLLTAPPSVNRNMQSQFPPSQQQRVHRGPPENRRIHTGKRFQEVSTHHKYVPHKVRGQIGARLETSLGFPADALCLESRAARAERLIQLGKSLLTGKHWRAARLHQEIWQHSEL